MQTAADVLDRIVRYAGLPFLLYALLVAFIPAIRLQPLDALAVLIFPIVPAGWFTSLVLGNVMILGRLRYFRDAILAIQNRPPMHYLYESPMPAFRVFEKDVVLSLDSTLALDADLLQRLKTAKVITKSDLLERIKSREQLDALASQLGVRVPVLERVAYLNFTRPEVFRQQVERSRRRTLVALCIVGFSALTIFTHAWFAIGRLQSHVLPPEELLRESLATMVFESPVSKIDQDKLIVARQALRSMNARPDQFSSDCKDVLLWIINEMMAKRSKDEHKRFLQAVLKIPGCGGESEYDLHLLKGRIAFTLSVDGTHDEHLKTAIAEFDSAATLPQVDPLVRNGAVACRMLSALLQANDTLRWRGFEECLTKLNALEAEMKANRMLYRAAVLSKVWNNKAYALMELLNDYWNVGDSLAMRGLGVPRRYPTMIDAPVVFLDSLSTMLDWAITHDEDSPIYRLSMAQIELTRGRFWWQVDHMSASDVYQSIEGNVASRVREAIARGWDPVQLYNPDYRRRYHFDLFDDLGHAEWSSKNFSTP